MADEKLTPEQVESNLVVAAAHRMQFEGPIATYIITGTGSTAEIELWDAHGRYCKTSLLPEPEPTRKPKKGK